MKKILLLIPLFLFSLLANAKEFTIVPSEDDILRSKVSACTDAENVIILDEDETYGNTYGNSTSDYIVLNHNITIRAAEGANPVIKPIAPLQISGGATVKFIGIKFDGTSIGSYDYLLRYNDANENNILEFEDCEFTGVAKYMLLVKSSCNAKSLIFKNCVIHDITSYVVYNNNGTLNSLKFENSTIYDNTNYIVYNKTGTLSSLTFENTQIHDNSKYIIYNYGVINAAKFNGGEISSNTEHLVYNSATYRIDSCSIKNCNIHDNSKIAVYNEGTLAQLSINGGKFYKMNGDAVIKNTASMSGIVIEGTEFYENKNYNINGSATSHADSCIIKNCYFHGNKRNAVLFDKSSTSGVESIDKFVLKNSTIANNDSLSDHNSQVYIRAYNDDKTNTIKAIVDHCTFYNNPTKNYDHSNLRFYKIKDVTISNCIFAHTWPGVDIEDGAQDARYAALSEAGTVTNSIAYNYLKNSSGFSGMTPSGCSTANPLFTDAANGDFTFPGDYVNDNVSPARGAATDGTDLGDPRWYTEAIYPETDFASGYAFTAARAKLNGNITLETNEEAPTHPYIRYIHINATTGTAEWIIKATRACYVSATINMADNEWTTDPSDAKMYKNHNHIFVVEIRDKDNNLVGSVQEGPYTDGSEDGYGTYPTVNLPGTIHIEEPGIYTVKLLNPRKETRCGVANVTLAYAGGGTIAISAESNTSLPLADALINNCDRTANYIKFQSSGTPWIKWNISTSETKFYDVSMIINAPNNHQLALAVYEDESADPVASVSESYVTVTEAAENVPVALGRLNLVGGKNYVVKVTNTSGSRSEVKSVTFAPVVASSTALPNTLDFANAVLSPKANISDGKLYFGTGADYTPIGQWARWAVTTDHDGLFLFTMDVSYTGSQSYKISIYDDGENLLDFFESNPGSGDKTLTHYFALEAGAYSVQVENTYSYSKGHIVSLVVTEPDDVLTISETAANADAWAAKVNDGNSYNVQIIRTLKGGMYNTFCLPFAYEKVKEVFGKDVKIYTMDEAVVEEGGFVLNLTLEDASDIYQGTPVFIKPSRDIVNPVFEGVQFMCASTSASTGTHANFTGTFVKTTLTAGSDVLFLAANDLLYYPTADIDVLGMRGWLVIHDSPTPAPAISRARIVEHGQVATEIELVGNTLPTEFSDSPVRKLIQNGQLIILRDGVEYNVMGVRVK